MNKEKDGDNQNYPTNDEKKGKQQDGFRLLGERVRMLHVRESINCRE